MEEQACEECRFAASEWTLNDAVRTIYPLGPWWREIVAGTGSGALLDLAQSTRDALQESGAALRHSLGDPEADPAPPPGPLGPAPVEAELAMAIDDIDNVAFGLVGALGSVPADQWRASPEADVHLRDLVHRVTHDLKMAGRLAKAAGGGSPTMGGTVQGLHRSDGGVPKLPTPSVQIDSGGVVGDRQATRKHHGRPWQALCLWSAEVIAELQGEGHPIGPGCAGENVTIRGVHWDRLRPGARVRIGSALAEISLYALPCKKNAQWFLDGDFNRILHSRHPGSSRLYAWVIEDGSVNVGDAVTVEPT